MCSCGKLGYPSQEQAKDAHKSSSDRLRFYKCPASALWHSTNDEKHGKRGDRQRGARARQAKRRQKNRTARRKTRSELRGQR